MATLGTLAGGTVRPVLRWILSFSVLGVLAAAFTVTVTSAAGVEPGMAEPIVLADVSSEAAAPADPEAAPDLAAPAAHATPGMPDAADVSDLVDVAAAVDASRTAALAVAVSRRLFPTGGVENIILTRDPPTGDAFAAGALVGLFDTTILLTQPERLTAITADEIARLGRPDIHILGGANAVSADVERQLAAAGHAVHRHAGATQSDTAVNIGQAHFPHARTAVLIAAPQLAPQGEPGVALAAAALAATRKMPLLFTDVEALSGATRAYLTGSGVQQVVVVTGAEAGITAGVTDDLTALGIEWFRWSGRDQFATAVAIARNRGFLELADADTATLVDVQQETTWLDAFLHAVVMDGAGGPVLLTDGAALPQVTADYLATADGAVEIICASGVATQVCRSAKDIAGAP